MLYREEGDDLVIFASYAGAPTHPAWYHNIVANPDVTVELGTETRTVTARIAGADERERCGVDHKQDWPQFGSTRTRPIAAIPVVILEPVG